FDGRKFSPIQLTAPRGITYWGWGWYQVAFQDSAGLWWIPTGQGLIRYPRLNSLEQITSARPAAIYTTRDGLSGDAIFRLFEDSRGDIWISSINRPEETLTRLDRKTGTFHRYSTADGIPQSAPTAFCEDPSGNLW